MVQNYRTGFVRLSISHYLNKDFQKAEAALLKMEEIMPSSIIPIPSKQLQYQIAQVYSGVGNQAKMKYHMKELVERKDLLLDDYILYGKTFIQFLEDYDESKLIFETIEKEWQDWQQSLPEIIYLLFLSYKNLEMYDEAKILLNDWINKNPADDNAKELFEEILQLESS